MTGSLRACAGHCGALVDAAPSRGDDYIALDLARGQRHERTVASKAAMYKYTALRGCSQFVTGTAMRASGPKDS